MKVKLQLTTSSKIIEITDEHAASSYGIPVAIVDNKAYGPADELPVWPENDELSFLHEKAAMTVAGAIRTTPGLNEDQKNFCRKFFIFKGEKKPMKPLTCKRCGHEWWPRSPKKPVLCPSCKSKYWDEKRKKGVEKC